MVGLPFRTRNAMTGCRLRAALLLLVLGTGAPSPLEAQSEPQSGPQGSRYLSLDHPAYEAVGGLVDRGLLPDLDPLSQPYRRLDIAVGLHSLDVSGFSEPVTSWVRLLREVVEPELARLDGEKTSAFGVQVGAGGTFSSSRRLDPLLPFREEAEATGWLNYDIGGWAESSWFAGEMRLQHDLWYEEGSAGDPDGSDPGGIVVFNRTDNAYVTARYPLGTLFVGRTRRNWAPLGTTGLMLSDVPTTFPQIAFDVAISPLKLEFVVGELDMQPGVYDVEWKRWLVANRITFRRPDLALSVGEARVVSTRRNGLALRNLNPFELYFFDQETLDANGQPDDFSVNTNLNGEFWIRREGAVFFGEAMLDDIDVAPEEGQDREPMSYALSLGARITSLIPGAELGMEYRRVSAFAYRSLPMDTWSYFDRGLGDAFSDYERVTLSASIWPGLAGLRVTPAVQYQRKGEGDLRLPVPEDDAVYRAQPSIFLGTVERTLRFSLQGHFQPVTWFFVEWDAGANVVQNAEHVAGEKKTEFSGVARLGFRLEQPLGGG